MDTRVSVWKWKKTRKFDTYYKYVVVISVTVLNLGVVQEVDDEFKETQCTFWNGLFTYIDQLRSE